MLKKLRRNPLYIVVILIIGTIFFIYLSKRAKSCSEAYVELRPYALRGKVINKYIDKSNHAYKTIVLSKENGINDTLTFLQFDKSNLFLSLRAGDSIVKENDSYVITVYRDTMFSKFTVDYECK